MKFETQKDRPLIQTGEHILKLASVEVREMDDRYGRSSTGKVNRIVWQFVSNEADEDGAPYEYAVFTGELYGNEKAGMTALVDMLVPGMTPAKFAAFDTDDLIGKRFRAQIKHIKKDDGTGMKAVHVYLAPVGTKAAEAKPASLAVAKPGAVFKAAPELDTEIFDPFE